MTNLLHSLGYIYKKPKLILACSDEQLKKFFIRFYLDNMENKPSDELVFFADVVPSQHNILPDYGWIRKGENRELKSNNGRSRFNIHAAMNVGRFKTTVVTSESNLDQESTVALLNQLLILYPYAKKMLNILDNAKYHCSKGDRDFAEKNINLVYLPAYSPELNMIESL
ncbi:MAG: transposase [Francisellaceae bacterium]|nr:transposase [Francisellaceae bacterium]